MYLSSLRRDRLGRLLDALDLSVKTARTLTDPEVLRDELSATWARGYSTDNEEFMDGMAALAVPILDDRRRLLSTLSIHAPIQRHDLTGLINFLPRMQEAASNLRDIALGADPDHVA